MIYVPEYLVHFETLETIALEYGLKLVKKENFHEYYDSKVGDSNPSTGSRQHFTNLLDFMVKRKLEMT